MNPAAQHPFAILKTELRPYAIEVVYENEHIHFTHGLQSFSFQLGNQEIEPDSATTTNLLPLDYLVKEPLKVSGLVLSRLGLNKTVFARQCELKKIDKQTANQFLNTYHFLYAAQSAYNLGLVYKNDLLCLASFSKGRKMNRLAAEQRSFELIRFCCKTGYTITGGLSRLVKNFAQEKKAGDIMTYVDKQLSQGRSFTSVGFKKVTGTEPAFFLVNRITFEKTRLKDPDQSYDSSLFYRSKNRGNMKLIYTPGE